MSHSENAVQSIGSKRFLKEIVSPKVLEPGIYRFIPRSSQTPSHLDCFTDFTLPSKIYGKPLEYLTDKVLNTFNVKNRSVGVLLSGLKGTGKSLQLKHLALHSKMPAIVIDSFVPGSELIDFLEKVPTSCMLLFDEFEKVYHKRQNQLLPILDGICSTPHIFVLTVNGTVSSFLTGRPGRIRYSLDYNELDEDLILEIINDLCIGESRKKEIFDSVSLISELNMDSLVSLIEEANLYKDESISDILKTFNLDDPLEGLFNFNIVSKGLFIESPEHSFETSNTFSEISDFLAEKKLKFRSLSDQFLDEEAFQNNMNICHTVLDKFPERTSINNYNFRARLSIDDIYFGASVYFNKEKDFKNEVGKRRFLNAGQIEMFIPNMSISSKNRTIQVLSNNRVLGVLNKDASRSMKKNIVKEESF